VIQPVEAAARRRVLRTTCSSRSSANECLDALASSVERLRVPKLE
jgi:hypothetical protein